MLLLWQIRPSQGDVSHHELDVPHVRESRALAEHESPIEKMVENMNHIVDMREMAEYCR